MFAICLESSHQKGMGHVFRVINFIEYLHSHNEAYIVIINDHKPSCLILQKKNIPFHIVDLSNNASDWETEIIKKYNITVWINDRLDTDIRHAENIKKNRVKLVTFDDRGSGSTISDINIAALLFDNQDAIKGHKILTGIEYLILNSAIDKYKRTRASAVNIIVTLGGSDTYGVTLTVIRILKSLQKKATIHIGPSFEHHRELDAEGTGNFHIIHCVPSLIEKFYNYDLAVTGGGITPFEANASGLPCIVIANEEHEIHNAQYLEKLNSSVFAGFHKNIDRRIFSKPLDIEKMSLNGMKEIGTGGAEKIYSEIIRL